MKITKAQEKQILKKLPHITGECMCPASSKTCIYWKNVDKGVENWQAKELVKLIKEL